MKRIALTFSIVLSLLAALAMASLPGAPAQAQGSPETITVGDNKLGQLTVEMPNVSYVFNAQAGQTVEIEVLSLTEGLAVQFAVYQKDFLVQAVGNPSLANSLSDVMTFQQEDSYRIVVQAIAGQGGEFILRVNDTRPVIPPTPLDYDVPRAGTLEAGESIVFSFSGDPNAQLILALGGAPDGPNVSLRLRTDAEEVIGSLSSVLGGGGFVIPSGSQRYTVELAHERPDLGPLDYEISVTSLAPTTSQAPPQEAPSGVPAGVSTIDMPTDGPCVIATLNANPVNAHTGPALDFNVVTALQPDSLYPVMGHNGTFAWFLVDFGGGTGWVPGTAMRLGGVCDTLGEAPLGGASPASTPPPTIPPISG